MMRIINSFQHSGYLCEKLALYQRTDEVEELKPITWCTTRWNSLLDSIERFLIILPQLTKTVVDHNLKPSSTKITLINEDQIKTLEEVKEILKPVSISTTELLGDSMTLKKGVQAIEFIEISLAEVQDSPIKRKFIEILTRERKAE
ncbi:MAG: hypothetical protein MHMPM18_000362 [Marteilia pararefringens]